MSNDLISRKKLLKDIIDRCGCIPYLEDGRNETGIYIDEVINQQPTAYDVDKVVKELENTITLEVKQYPIHGKYIKQNMAINTVKEGGKR